MSEMDKIRWLRNTTDAPYPACKEALLANGGDRDLALDWLYAQGLATKPRLPDRHPDAGIIASVTIRAAADGEPRVSWWKRLWTK